MLCCLVQQVVSVLIKSTLEEPIILIQPRDNFHLLNNKEMLSKNMTIYMNKNLPFHLGLKEITHGVTNNLIIQMKSSGMSKPKKQQRVHIMHQHMVKLFIQEMEFQHILITINNIILLKTLQDTIMSMSKTQLSHHMTKWNTHGPLRLLMDPTKLLGQTKRSMNMLEMLIFTKKFTNHQWYVEVEDKSNTATIVITMNALLDNLHPIHAHGTHNKDA